jgi:hypothetical protein
MSTEYEFSDAGTDDFGGGWGDLWSAQTFTIGTVGTDEFFNIDYVKVYLRKQGSPIGNVEIAICTVDSNGYPTSSSVASGTIAVASLTTVNTQYTINFATVALNAGATYAIRIRLIGSGDASNFISSEGDQFGNPYAGGFQFESIDGGVSWIKNSLADLRFQVWGTALGSTQVQSSSIDYNNGIISSVKLITTTTTNPISFYVSADGGSNWEYVISGSTIGTIHNFTNTGTDLRWKAKGRNGLAIYNVELKDYH